MDLLKDDIKKVYFKYLAASVGSVLITTVYSLVDMAMVGQYEGPAGAAALAVVAPVYNIIFGLGMLAGIGGSVLYGVARGSGKKEEADRSFTAAMIFALLLAVFAWALIFFFTEELLLLFGADEAILPIAMEYLAPIRFAVPCFVSTELLAAFLRNDGDPVRATAAVLSGGIFNMVGDWFFVFALDMGAFGAGLATAIGGAVGMCVALTHFVSRKNTLCLVWPTGFFRRVGRIISNGFSAFFNDVSMGIVTTLFNRQIMRYLGGDVLSVYSAIMNTGVMVQCCAYAVGQSAQPVLSVNFGAIQRERIRKTAKCALVAAVCIGAAWMSFAMIWPNAVVRFFMKPTAEVLAIAPAIIRRYAPAFLLLGINVFSAYYFQSVMQAGLAFGVSVARGCVVSSALVMLLPAVLPAENIFFAAPLTELLIAIPVLILVFRPMKFPKEA